MKTCAIVLAGGRGLRMGSALNKHLCLLAGRPLIEHTLRAFQNHPSIDEIILVGLKDLLETYGDLVERASITKVTAIVPGGELRQDSCYGGLQAVGDAEVVLIHDGARPVVSAGLIEAIVRESIISGAVTAAVPVKDTIKRATGDLLVAETLDRSILWQAQTPQGFRVDLFRRAHEHARQHGLDATDDVGLVERLGIPVKIVIGEYSNLKVTTPEDLVLAEILMNQASVSNQPAFSIPDFRVGLGQDSHRFSAVSVSKPLILGGVVFEGEPALEAKSDGDVILHAVFNALSQAIGGRSIGYYADPLAHGQGIMDSRRYLDIAMNMVREQHYLIGNVGISIECRAPRIEPRSEDITRCLANLLGVTAGQVSITATSGEGLTAFGRGEGIQVLAIVGLIRERPAG